MQLRVPLVDPDRMRDRSDRVREVSRNDRRLGFVIISREDILPFPGDMTTTPTTNSAEATAIAIRTLLLFILHSLG